jgi:drug/metabolite transporter (DMT)-like permease
MARKEVPLAWFILFSLMLIWGSSFILIKKALLYFDAIEVGGLRMVMAWLLLLPYAIKRIRRFDRSTWLFLAISGFMVARYLHFYSHWRSVASTARWRVC